MTAATIGVPLPGAGLAARGGSKKVLPGFDLTLGYTLLYLSLIVLIPLSALVFRTFALSWGEFWAAISSPRVLASYRLTFGASLVGGADQRGVRAACWRGCWCATAFRARRSSTRWSICRSRCRRRWRASPSRRSCAGNGWIGQYLEPLGIKVAFTPLGVVVALIFIGLPFVVRTVQPVLEDTRAGAGRSGHVPRRHPLADASAR